mmetsp:Transcript_6841/g.21402  ORF Transcript_6841/g.21402 Transcript_6841/m.21402 type:complete len:212 (-) Transcript_6841:270-905(-)
MLRTRYDRRQVLLVVLEGLLGVLAEEGVALEGVNRIVMVEAARIVLLRSLLGKGLLIVVHITNIFCRLAGPNLPTRDAAARRNDGSRGNDSARLNEGPLADHRTSTNNNIAFDGACPQHTASLDRDKIPDLNRSREANNASTRAVSVDGQIGVLAISGDDRAFQNVSHSTDNNRVLITTDHRTIPHSSSITNADISGNGAVRSNKGLAGNL